MAHSFLPHLQRFRWRSYQHLKHRSLLWFMAGLAIFCVTYIPLQLTIARSLAPQPQAILTLGGRSTREAFTAKLAQAYPQLDVWISSGLAAEESIPYFQRAGVELERVHFDRQAVDTVTNFTTLVDEFQERHIHHLYLITSDFHMARAKAIATIVFGSHRITVTPIRVKSYCPPESWLHIGRDIVRSLVWLFTGYTGANLRSYVQLIS